MELFPSSQSSLRAVPLSRRRLDNAAARKKKKCGSKLWWSPVISKQFLWHHLCTVYLPNMEELAMSEWVREWVSEWVSIFFIFLWRMKRRVYVISVSLYIFCRRNNGQVPTHTLKGKLRRQIRLWRVSWALGQCSYTRQPSSFPSFTDTTVPFGISQWKVDKTQTHAV